MKRRNHRHQRKRTARPAVFKQQMLRREARKRAKYPLRIVYVPPRKYRQIQERGAWYARRNNNL